MTNTYHKIPVVNITFKSNPEEHENRIKTISNNITQDKDAKWYNMDKKAEGKQE